MEPVILAGGEGRRLRPVISDVPKPMARVAGKPFLEILMEYWISQGIRRFVLAVGYKHDMIEKHFGSRYKNADIVYSVEEKLLGTGGGLVLALSRLTDEAPFLVLNGDTYFEVPLGDMIAFHNKKNAEWTIALAESAEKGRYGSVKLEEGGRITGIQTDAAQSKRRLINGGVYLINRNLFAKPFIKSGEKKSIETEIIPAFTREKKRMYGLISEARFVDIGIPHDYEKASSMF